MEPDGYTVSSANYVAPLAVLTLPNMKPTDANTPKATAIAGSLKSADFTATWYTLNKWDLEAERLFVEQPVFNPFPPVFSGTFDQNGTFKAVFSRYGSWN